MRCNTLLVFVFAAVSAPALAAPLGASDNSFVARNSVEARKLAARGYTHKDASGARSLGPALLPPAVLSSLFAQVPTQTPTATDNAPTQTSTTTDSVATPTPTISDGAFIHKPIWRNPVRFPVPIVADKVPILPPALQTRELHELLLRAMSDDESGAGIWGDLWNIGSHVLTSIIGGGGNSQPQLQAQPQQPQQQQVQQDPQQQQVQQRRDLDAMYELLARAIDDDESGANFLTNALHIATQIIGPLLMGNNQPQPQPIPATSVQQLPQPEAQPQQQTQQQRRDVDIMYELLARAAADDESGASIWSTLAGFAASLFGGNNQRRDVDVMYELLARAAAANDSDDESGANFWSDFTNIAGTVASAIFGRDGEMLQRREVYELLKRAAEDDESGAGLLDFFSQIFL